MGTESRGGRPAARPLVVGLLGALLAVVSCVSATVARAGTGTDTGPRESAVNQFAADQGGQRRITCDAVGDLARRNDCIVHRGVDSALDRALRRGESFRVRVGVHRALEGATLRTAVQFRRTGRPGAHWQNRKVVTWTPGRDDTHIAVRAPSRRGLFSIRVRSTVIPDPRKRQVTAAATTVVTSQPTLAASGVNCPLSDQDEMIVEYFNMMVFNDSYEVLVTDVGPAFQIQLLCPTPLNAEYPPAQMSLQLFAGDQVSAIGCSTASPATDPAQTLVISKAALAAKKLDYCNAGSCDFLMILSNQSSQMIYSETELRFTMPTGSVPNQSLSYLPQLNPATVPICNNVLSPCLLEGACHEATGSQISLCSQPQSCQPPARSPSVNFTDSVHFDAALVDPVT